MTYNSTSFSVEEGQSISKPPFFNGENYPYWKNSMMLFIQSTDYMFWDVVLDGPFTPVKREGDTLVPKQRHEWNDEEKRRVQMNAKAMHILFCALGPDEYAKMSSCSSAKEIWDKLEVTHEGTSEVKETKIGLPNLSYENFKMERDKDIKKMFDWFSVIVNGLKGLCEEDDEEMTFLARRFTRFMKSNRGRKFLRKEEFKNKNREEEKDQLICYECKKLGHIRTECPRLKKKSFGKKKKLKAYVANWSDEESSNEDDDEVANLCLMALDDETKMRDMRAKLKDFEKKNQDFLGLLSNVQEDHKKEASDLKASLNKGENCYKAKASSANSWYLDSGCSRHMTGDKSRFLELKSKSGGVVTFGDNSKGHIEGIGSIGAKGKQHRTSFKSINDVSTSRVMQLIHLDLFGPIRTISLGGKSYAFVLVDDYSRYTWVLFEVPKMRL
ncbi:hypothetical protein V6N11_049831 [Hibiscus sabdariffa]|uniref:CCHC-type domain-containing protein n=1 Tax=Hibiscus sabdariffa TaxID=183260 RepID=A0ABR2T819_9ROSI